MNISFIIQLFQTPTCVILSLSILVLISGFVLRNLHVKYKDFEINTKSKKSKKKKHKKQCSLRGQGSLRTVLFSCFKIGFSTAYFTAISHQYIYCILYQKRIHGNVLNYYHVFFLVFSFQEFLLADTNLAFLFYTPLLLYSD